MNNLEWPETIAGIIGFLAVFTLLIVGVLAVYSLAVGFFIWLLWPPVVNAALPGLVASGAIAAKLTFWQSMLTALLASVLFKAANFKWNKGE